MDSISQPASFVTLFPAWGLSRACKSGKEGAPCFPRGAVILCHTVTKRRLAAGIVAAVVAAAPVVAAAAPNDNQQDDDPAAVAAAKAVIAHIGTSYEM